MKPVFFIHFLGTVVWCNFISSSADHDSSMGRQFLLDPVNTYKTLKLDMDTSLTMELADLIRSKPCLSGQLASGGIIPEGSTAEDCRRQLQEVLYSLDELYDNHALMVQMVRESSALAGLLNRLHSPDGEVVPPPAFFGMRGKRNVNNQILRMLQEQLKDFGIERKLAEDSVKDLDEYGDSANGFLGMRGKKANGELFAAQRGKKNDVFVGMRGKKAIWGEFTPTRGKKATWDEFSPTRGKKDRDMFTAMRGKKDKDIFAAMRGKKNDDQDPFGSFSGTRGKKNTLNRAFYSNIDRVPVTEYMGTRSRRNSGLGGVPARGKKYNEVAKASKESWKNVLVMSRGKKSRENTNDDLSSQLARKKRSSWQHDHSSTTNQGLLVLVPTPRQMWKSIIEIKQPGPQNANIQ